MRLSCSIKEGYHVSYYTGNHHVQTGSGEQKRFGDHPGGGGSPDGKGYNPIDQLAGYLLSGDPAYVTSYKDARLKIRRFERYELIEALLQAYLEGTERR